MSCLTGVIFLFLTFLGVNSWKLYGGKHGQSDLPSSIRRRVEATEKELTSEAHIIKPHSIDTSNEMRVTFDLSTLPAHLSNGTFLMDELYMKFKAPREYPSADLWIVDSPSRAPLARVALTPRRTGYQRVILGKWSKSIQADEGALIMVVKPGPPTAKDVLGSSPLVYLVAYGTRIISPQGGIPKPKPVRCHAHSIYVGAPDNIIAPDGIPTKICSPLENTTFPFWASREFDMGQTVRAHLTTHPLPRDVRENPSCCHAVRASPMSFLIHHGKGAMAEVTLHAFSDIRITQCGCDHRDHL